MTTVWQIADKIRTAGVVTTLHFDPSQLTVRIRKAAQRMLQSGTLSGGWSSQSRKVAELVAAHHRLPMMKVRCGYVYVDRRSLNDEDMQTIKRLYHADITAFKLEPNVPDWYTRRGQGREYIESTVTRHLEQLDNFEMCRVNYIHFIDEAFAKQAAQAIAERHMREFADLRECAAAYLDTNACIPIPEFN